MLTFISYAELVKDAGLFSEQLEKHDIVVGIPRSGLIPAQVIAERWNVPMSTPSLMRNKVILEHGHRLKIPTEIKSILVIDDTVNVGKEMAKAREMLSKVPQEVKITYAAVYATNSTVPCTFFKILPQPRVFEWNWTHHNIIDQCCCDMDGVLCRPPTPQENDYGENYEKFLANTEPRYIPSRELKAIITGRLEKYRKQTEDWLFKHGVKYGELIMRENAKIPHHEHKSVMLHGKFPMTMFIEDEPAQAQAIHELTKQPVLCVTNWKVHQVAR